MGTMVIDSVPPATITCAAPARIRSAAMAIACNPEEQNRFTVIAEVSIGSPARSAAIRATFIPCSPSGIAHPRITSAISFASSPGTRARASLIANAAKSSGRVARNDPLNAFPTGVRTEETITGSAMATSQTGFPPYCWATSREKQINQLLGRASVSDYLAYPALARKTDLPRLKKVASVDLRIQCSITGYVDCWEIIHASTTLLSLFRGIHGCRESARARSCQGLRLRRESAAH